LTSSIKTTPEQQSVNFFHFFPKVLRDAADVQSRQVKKEFQMKIDKTTPPLPSAQIGEVASRTGNAKPAVNNEPGTSVNLSEASANLRTIETGVSSAPSVNASKVAEIKQAITEGRFQVNAGAVADSLINSVKEMLGTAQR
jgi:negative regulator of flagellin synthesis FlgM